jgi:hypothetical protein
MGLLSKYVKPCISCNEYKSNPNNIMGCNPFPTMGAIEEVDPHGVQRLAIDAMCQTKRQRMGEVNLVRNIEKKIFEGKRKHGMIRRANNQAPVLGFAQDFKYIWCESEDMLKMMLEKEWWCSLKWFVEIDLFFCLQVVRMGIDMLLHLGKNSQDNF